MSGLDYKSLKLQAIMLKDGTTVQLGEMIGRGAFGVVRKAVLREKAVERTVAVKMLGAGATEKQLGQFMSEILKCIEISKRCDGTARTFGAHIHDGQLLMVMKLYTGNMQGRLERGKLQSELVVKYTQQILRGLVSLHESGVAVLDLKPANLLFDDCNDLVISDFGISSIAVMTMTAATANHGGGAGTAPYKAPEQFLAGVPGCKADMWALACVIVQMHTGESPWVGLSELQIGMAVAQQQQTLPIPDDLQCELAKLASKCLVHDPEARIDSLAALQLLQEMLASRGRQELLETSTAGAEPLSHVLARNLLPSFSPTKTCSEYLLQDVSQCVSGELSRLLPSLVATCGAEVKRRVERGVLKKHGYSTLDYDRALAIFVFTCNIGQFYKHYGELLRTTRPSKALQQALVGFSYFLFDGLGKLPPCKGLLLRGIDANGVRLLTQAAWRERCVHCGQGHLLERNELSDPNLRSGQGLCGQSRPHTQTEYELFARHPPAFRVPAGE